MTSILQVQRVLCILLVLVASGRADEKTIHMVDNEKFEYHHHRNKNINDNGKYQMDNGCIVGHLSGAETTVACAEKNLTCCTNGPQQKKAHACIWQKTSVVVCANSCTGKAACAFFESDSPPINIGKGSCNGDLACVDFNGTVGENSCIGDIACGEAGIIGAGSCIGDNACESAQDIRDGSCIGDYACNGPGFSSTVGSGSCLGFAACAGLEGSVSDRSCTADSACYSSGSVGEGSCTGEVACREAEHVGDGIPSCPRGETCN